MIMETLPNRLRPDHRKQPMRLTFAPLAWLKMQFFCHRGDTEVGGFGIAAAEDLLYVAAFVAVRQHVTPVRVRFGDNAVADSFDRSVEVGLAPQQFARLWMHTHPGASVTPSGTDEATFARTFGACDWALMFILGRTGQTYARLSFAAGPGGQLLVPTAVDWSVWPAWAERWAGSGTAWVDQWQREYAVHIQRQPEAAPDPTALEQLFGPGTDCFRWENALGYGDLDDPFWEVWAERDCDEPHPNHPPLDRDVRQRALVPPARLAACQALVVGVGDIGRQVALQLAALGVPGLNPVRSRPGRRGKPGPARLLGGRPRRRAGRGHGGPVPAAKSAPGRVAAGRTVQALHGPAAARRRAVGRVRLRGQHRHAAAARGFPAARAGPSMPPKQPF